MNPTLEKIEKYSAMTGAWVAGVSILLTMLIEVLNAFGRKLLMPFPCTLETAESLMITTVFLGIGLVAMVEEHTNVTILTGFLGDRSKSFIDGLAYLFAVLIFCVLAFGAWKIAVAAVQSWEIRIGVYRFPIWAFRVLFAFGLTHMAFHCLLVGIRKLKFNRT